MNIFDDKPLMITLILLVVLTVLLFANIGSSDESIVGRWIAPAQQKLYEFTNRISRSFEAVTETDALIAENLRLKEANAALNVELMQMDELKRENERLSDLLKFTSSVGYDNFVAARVIGKAPGNWFSEFTIDVGLEDGIESGMVVIAEDGLIGKVSVAYSTYSKVISIIEISTGVPAMLERSRDYCVVNGQASEVSDDGTLLGISFISDQAGVVPGDKVITSGIGGVYPKGLLIGTVTSVSNDLKEVTIISNADFMHIEEVVVIKQLFEEVDQ